jgi:hypothetical protein
MNALKRKPDFRGGLNPLVRLEKRILSYLPSSRTRGLEVRSLTRIVTYLTFGVSDWISKVTMPKTTRRFPLKGNEVASLRGRSFMLLQL